MTDEENPFIAAWSRNGNLLCHGHWIITFAGKPVTLPQRWQDKAMGTWGIYSIIDPEDETFADGLEEDEWIVENVEWLTDCFFENHIPPEEDNYRFFWRAVNRADWRCTSCAGCM
ncbi:hypothetical protein [Franconibacter pulveris]|uniref:Uncharacterized protein n=1 Tax=Franconibacter pulveris TaxID=435910 RepID=A0A0J8VL11_9ENTR|nr:hypothetical protein [Franconibacter pulveris]KMV33737.1 hypothetical protein ACH50_15485 [Franconibacter pulveris]KMV36612.1 hypothetical protein ACH50_00840 [Franconibacter pulveris]